MKEELRKNGLSWSIIELIKGKHAFPLKGYDGFNPVFWIALGESWVIITLSQSL